MKRKCKVCGARVRAFDDRIETCDAICSRAIKSGRSRSKQIKIEIKLEAQRAALLDPEPDSPVYSGGDLEFANRPYLAAAYA
jgi:hypothetical protein